MFTNKTLCVDKQGLVCLQTRLGVLTDKGWYVYAEASTPNLQGDNTKLISPTLTGNSVPRCLSFWYHMFGPHIGSLTLSILVCISLWKFYS